jgi:serine/threonine protein kinase
MTGDLVGTLRYMSPEQALAKRVTVDARTDVYSLGVTLYELLTLEPAYNGRNREEVLRQIAFEEPRAPARLNKAIPAELETVVLKAMAKNPEERYATAQELVDDLRRFLEDKPIKARRPTLRQRAAKWARRHRTELRVAIVMLFLALAVSTGLISWAYRDKSQALERKRREALLRSRFRLVCGTFSHGYITTETPRSQSQEAQSPCPRSSLCPRCLCGSKNSGRCVSATQPTRTGLVNHLQPLTGGWSAVRGQGGCGRRGALCRPSATRTRPDVYWHCPRDNARQRRNY